MKPRFKSASTADIEQLIELMQEFYLHERLTFDPQVARLALTQLIEHHDLGQVELIQLDQNIAGYLVVTFGFSLEFGGRDAFVDELYLRPDYRGQGIGTQALEWAATLCREREIRALHLEVEHANLRAQAVYRTRGFVDHDRYLMTKWL